MTVKGIARQIKNIEKLINILQHQINELGHEKLGLVMKLEKLIQQDEKPF